MFEFGNKMPQQIKVLVRHVIQFLTIAPLSAKKLGILLKRGRSGVG
jgi:hypothetical protein